MSTRAPKNLTGADVVRAALVVLNDVGLDGLTMRLVAKQLGVQLNTVYWHAKNKPELLEMIADACWAIVAASRCRETGRAVRGLAEQLWTRPATSP